MSLLAPATIGTIPGLQAALDAKAPTASPTLTGQSVLNGGTLTNPAVTCQLNVTWNDAADTFDLLDLNITDTASSATSRGLRLRTNGVEMFSVRKDGEISGISVNTSGAVRSQQKLWCSGPTPKVVLGDSQDVALGRYSADVLEVTNGTAGQRRDLMLRSLWDSGGNQVVGTREAAVADATDAATVITQLNNLLAKLRTHGLIAP